MAMEASEIERLIKEAMPDAQVSIEDLRGDGDHYAAHVVSEAFRGKVGFNNTRSFMQPCREGWGANCTPWPCKRRHQSNTGYKGH